PALWQVVELNGRSAVAALEDEVTSGQLQSAANLLAFAVALEAIRQEDGQHFFFVEGDVGRAKRLRRRAGRGCRRDNDRCEDRREASRECKDGAKDSIHASGLASAGGGARPAPGG